MELLWEGRRDLVTGPDGARHRVTVASYNYRDLEPTEVPTGGPPRCFGLKAEIEHAHGAIRIWLLCNDRQWHYFGGDRDPGAPLGDDLWDLDKKRKRLLEDFVTKVEKTFREGHLLPGDEIQIRLGAEIVVPEYGAEWRRSLSSSLGDDAFDIQFQ